MSRATQQSAINALLDKYDEELKGAFLRAVAEIRSTVVLQDVIAALEIGDLTAAVAAMNVEVAAYHALENGLMQAFTEGGQSLVSSLPSPRGKKIVFRWGMRNTPAEDWLRQHSSSLITRIVEDQVAAIRAALAGGMERGDNPRRTALDVVGRISRATGRREGGILGLSAQQERAVARARFELENGHFTEYMARERRDRRFDRTIIKAERDGRPLTVDQIDGIVGRYSDRMLDLRGEMIARTETMMSIAESRHSAMMAQIESGKLAADEVSKIWRSARDNRVRHTHRILNGKSVPLDGVFQSVSGAMLRFPGDPQAPVSEVSGCRCWLEYKIDYFAKVERQFKAAA